MSVVNLVILMSLGGLVFMYIILEFASIMIFGQFSGKSMSLKQNITYFYKVIKLINIKDFDDSFEVNTTMNGGYILNSTLYYMKIIDINTVLLVTKGAYQIGFTLSIYKNIDDNFIEDRITITDMPALLYYYRYYKLEKLIKKTECKLVHHEEVNKIINDHYIIYNRDTKLKQLLNDQ